MIPVHLSPLANHLWQSTLFAGLAMLLTLALTRNRAQARYWIWLAASVKFLVPFALLMTIGSQFEWRTAPTVAPPLSLAVEQISQPFAPTPSAVATPAAPAFFAAPALLMTLWFCGCVVVLYRWWTRWLQIRTAVRRASPLPMQAPIPVMSSPTLLEPGVFGLYRPVLLLPEGIADRLTSAQLQAILAHELCHVRRRDNLAAVVHMAVEAIFWFHPLVWWIGARLIEERERACDEEVLRLGNEPQAYAQGILNVCKFYLESPLACASGVTGADLKRRIEAIMKDRISHNLTPGRKLLLATAGLAAVAGPILIGILHAQLKPEALTFEVATIKPGDPDAHRVMFQLTPGGGLNAVNVGLKELIAFAYDIPCGKSCDSRITGGPGWINSQKFDILAKAPQPTEGNTDIMRMTSDQRKVLQDRVRQRLQALLAERFQLAIRRDTKEMPVYALVVAKNGPKLKESTGDGPQMMRGGRGELMAERAPIQLLVMNLAGPLGRPVLDRTGLTGRYDFKLEYTPEPGGFGPKGPGGPGEKAEGAAAPDLAGPSIFTALQEQLGLKLESTKGGVEVLIIDRAEKPTAN